MIVTRPPNMISQQKAGGADQLLEENEGKIEDEWLEDDDRIKFSRILAALKENSVSFWIKIDASFFIFAIFTSASCCLFRNSSARSSAVNVFDFGAGV